MSLSYNQLIQLNRSFVNAHHVLKNFGNGTDPEKVLHNQEAAYKYPLCWAEDLPGPISPGKEITAFRVYFLAPVEMLDSDDPENVDEPLMAANITEVKSDMKRCAQDYLSYWAQQHDYPKLKIEQNTAINFIEDTTFDSLYGCYVDVNFYQAFTWNTCAIPMGTPSVLPGPCSPAFVYANDTLVFQVASGDKYYFEIVDANGLVVGVWDSVEQKFTVPAGGSGINIDVNGVDFYVGQMTDVNLPVKDSTGTNNVGSKVGPQWRIGDSHVIVKNTIDDELLNVGVYAEQTTEVVVGDCEQTLNGDGVTSQPAETTKAIIVVNSEDDNIGNPVVDTASMLEISIGDSEVEINDSAGAPLHLVSVKAEGAAVQVISDAVVHLKDSNGDTFANVTVKAQEDKNHTVGDGTVQILDSATSVLYTKTVKAQGNTSQIITDSHVALKDNLGNTLQTVDVKAQATVNKNISDFVAKKVYYNRPFIQNCVSFHNYDEGWMFANNYDPPFHPTDGVLQRLDLTVSPDYLKYNNAFGHKFRLTGINGGYYDFNTASYKTVTGAASTFAAEFQTPVGVSGSAGGYVIDHLTGIAWSTHRGGSGGVTWDNMWLNGVTFMTFSDWYIPTVSYIMTLLRLDLLTNLGVGRPPFQWDQPQGWLNNTQINATINAYRFDSVSGQVTVAIKTSSGTANKIYSRLHYPRTAYVLQP